MRQMLKKASLLLALGFALVLGLSSCTGVLPTEISKLYENKDEYLNKNVKVKGKVETSVSILGFSGYIIDDGTGKILVIGDNETPTQGTEATASGKLSAPFQLDDSPLLIINAGEEK